MTKQSILMMTAASLIAAAPAFAQTTVTIDTGAAPAAETTTDVTANAETAETGAGTMAMAATELNLRAGPGPSFEVVGVIPVDGEVAVEGCLDESNWCQVTLDGTTGWAYGDYLNVMVENEPVVLYENRAAVEIQTVTYENEISDGEAAVGGAIGVAGAAAALIGGPAAIVAGSVLGAAAGDALNPESTSVTYVRENPIEPVILDGEVIVGAGIPEEVVLTPIPEAEYSYLYVNGQPVIVDPAERKVVYIVR